jgi:hypothetical protein
MEAPAEDPGVVRVSHEKGDVFSVRLTATASSVSRKYKDFLLLDRRLRSVALGVILPLIPPKVSRRAACAGELDTAHDSSRHG